MTTRKPARPAAKEQEASPGLSESERDFQRWMEEAEPEDVEPRTPPPAPPAAPPAPRAPRKGRR